MLQKNFNFDKDLGFYSEHFKYGYLFYNRLSKFYYISSLINTFNKYELTYSEFKSGIKLNKESIYRLFIIHERQSLAVVKLKHISLHLKNF